MRACPWLFVFLTWTVPLLAQDQAPPQPKQEKLLRIGGTYKIVKMDKLGEADFRIRFESAVHTGTYDNLVLHSDHVHMGLQEGQTLRISAEVVAEKAEELEITQVLLFLSHPEYGTTPVWLLSSQHVTREIRGSRWLEMHAPQADFLIL